MALNLTSIRRKPAPVLETYVFFEYEVEVIRPSFKRTYELRSTWAQAVRVEQDEQDGEFCFVILFNGEERLLPISHAKRIGQLIRLDGEIQKAWNVQLADVLPLELVEVLS